MVDDNEFAAYAAEVERQEAERQANRGSYSGSSRTYEQIKWSGLVPNQTKVVRVLGTVPSSPNADAFTAKIAQVAWIKNDQGKMFKCILPNRDTNTGKDHIMWRVISRINETAYIDRKRVFVNEMKHKEIFDLVNSNGLSETDKRKKFDKGWEGRQVIIMNVIDREQMDWHRENKHTMLLSRNIGLSKDGTKEYPEEGVPTFGFFDIISKNLFKNYGNWEGYDIGITRTGQTQPAYYVINASAYKAANLPELPEAVAPFVSVEKNLTDEERSWARYDLARIYNVSTYTKIYNNLQVAFRRIDATLGTTFTKELEFEVEKEKAARAARSAQTANESSDTDEENAPVIEESVSTATPVPEVAAPRTRVAPTAMTSTIKITADKIAALKGWGSLTDAQKSIIVDVTVDKTGKATDIKFDTTEGVLGCPQCRVPSPESFTICPACSSAF